tara:strand:+ start:4141 stop:5739 length:1599 start_codon:yes stop_codon:yes gene_type:complete
MGFIKTHQQCPDCGSSDARSINDDGSSYCFSCRAYSKSEREEIKLQPRKKNTMTQSFVQGKPATLAKRGLTQDTCEKWNYQVAMLNKEPVQIANYKDVDGKLVGQKIRYQDKRFSIRGELVGLYGMHLWKEGGKRVVVTEGEIDALSMSQAMDNKWPVVSVSNGAAGAKKSVARHLDWLETFDSVVFMFDSDDVGKKASKECASLLSIGKAKIATLPLKDANDMLTANRNEELIQASWNAREFRPDGILGSDDLWSKLKENTKQKSVPYPYAKLNAKTRGMRLGELVTVTAGSGIGKSLLCKEICLNLLLQGESVGYIALEESVRRTGLGIMGLHVGEQLHLKENVELDSLKDAFDETIGNGRFYTYDHFGSTDSDNLLGKIKYLCKGYDCNWIILDHLSIVVSGFEDGNERRIIDNTMTRLRTLVEETGCGMIVVSHLRRPEGRGHEEGGTTSLSQLRGSAGIAQLSDFVISMERNQQDEENANISRIRVLKNRFSGETGLAGSLLFDKETGRLNDYNEPEDEPEELDNPF